MGKKSRSYVLAGISAKPMLGWQICEAHCFGWQKSNFLKMYAIQYVQNPSMCHGQGRVNVGTCPACQFVY
jgi:hypothetical protein